MHVSHLEEPLSVTNPDSAGNCNWFKYIVLIRRPERWAIGPRGIAPAVYSKNEASNWREHPENENDPPIDPHHIINGLGLISRAFADEFK